ncbi:hypothetical protein LCGC14_2290230 [marine sediment metagenome]|uniref:Uncharacterized protein n=1 Tax=marine sediment metagenome TaxID=412755 RepID=A0A0F9FLQ0_9ZZZZ
MGVIKSQGLLLKKAGATIGQITAIDRAGLEAMMMETTDLDDANKTSESAGLTEPGTVSGTLLYDPDTAVIVQLETDLKAGTEASYTITYTDTSPAIDTFNATPTKFDITGSVGERIEATFELKISGAITRT